MLSIRFTFLLLFVAKIVFGQSNLVIQSSEINPDQQFELYLDSAQQFLYKDILVSKRALKQCDSILSMGSVIRDSLLMEYSESQIYYSYLRLDPIAAYQVIVDNEYLLESNDVYKDQVSQFVYLKSFTLMSIGDLEAAQNAYYHGIDLGKREKDTMSVINNLYSLGQLFYDEKVYESAIKSFEEVLSYKDLPGFPESTHALSYLELAAVYAEMQKYEKAKESLDATLHILEKYDLDFLRPNVLNQKGKVHLHLSEIDSAELVYKQLSELADKAEDDNYFDNLIDLRSELLRGKGKYSKALASYDEIISRTDTTKIDNLLNAYKNAYEVSSLMDNHQRAFNYLIAFNKIKGKKDTDSKRQKTEYLKIKYDSDQKEKDNALLKAELYKQKSEQHLLYGGLALTFVVLFGLVAAFFQKARYSKRLEDKVKQRTAKLNESNEQLNETNGELEELNRILSHDLKEPLRGIVSFSELASRDRTMSPKTHEYLDIVNKSGRQLDRLIDDVNILRESKATQVEAWTSYSLDRLVKEVLKEVKENHFSKSVELSRVVVAEIQGPQKTLQYVLKAIIDNAIKFNKNRVVEIFVDYKVEGSNHVLYIRDNGIGIDKQFHAQVFGMFKRLNIRDEYEGSGLGLSIAKQMIDAVGGQILVHDSTKGEGTTFAVSYPKTSSKKLTIVA